MMNQGILQVITPTLSEHTPVRAALGRALGYGQVRLDVCGMGTAAAEAFCRQLDRTSLPGGLLLVGWAGGVDARLAVGDVVVADAVVNERGERLPCAHLELPGAYSGSLLTMPVALFTAEAKRAAQAHGVLAVEMEAYPLAAWAQLHGMALVHVRVISDSLQEALPDLGDSLGPLGQVHLGRLAGLLWRQPSLLPVLLRLAGRMRRLGPILGQVTAAIVEGWIGAAPA